MKAFRISSLAVALMLLLGSSVGLAQQDSVGDLGLAARQDDLDSFWLETRNWYWYGYRPHAVHLSRFDSNLPNWNTGTSGYSFGINEPAGNAPWQGGPSTPFQLTKHGTWH
jgi:hypothetical protein